MNVCLCVCVCMSTPEMQILREVSALHWNRVCLALYIPSRYGPSALSCFGGARALSGAGSAFVCTARPVKPRGPNARVLSAGHRFALVLSGVLSSGRPVSGLAVAARRSGVHSTLGCFSARVRHPVVLYTPSSACYYHQRRHSHCPSQLSISSGPNE